MRPEDTLVADVYARRIDVKLPRHEVGCGSRLGPVAVTRPLVLEGNGVKREHQVLIAGVREASLRDVPCDLADVERVVIVVVYHLVGNVPAKLA